MASTGFPDFQQYAQWRGTPITLDASSIPPSTQQSSAYLYTSAWQSVLIEANVTSGSLQVDFEYTDDPAITSPVYKRQRRVNHLDVNTSWREILPAAGAAVRVTVTNNESAVTSTGTVTLTGVNLPATGVNGLVSYNHKAIGQTAVANGGTYSLYLPYVAPGAAKMFVYTPGSTSNGFSAAVYIINSDGTAGDELYSVGNISGRVSADLLLPPQQIALVLQNNTGGSVNVTNAAIIGQS